MSWTCSNCGVEEADSIECVMNIAAGTHKHLYACKSIEEKRQEAERNSRALEVLKEKTEQHGAKVCTLSGRPPDPDYAELHNAPQPVKERSGQHADYYVLCPEERAKGFVRPVRQSYIHDKCRTKTHMSLALAETYARDPKFYGATFCCCCGAHFPVAEFKWEDGETLGT